MNRSSHYCPLCAHPATTAQSLRLHLVTHSHTDILSITAPLSQLKPTPLLVCPRCTTKDCLYLGTQGLSLHQRHHPGAAPPASARSNSTLIHAAFASKTHHTAWLHTLQWLSSPDCQLRLPPFRYSLYSKLSSLVKRSVQDRYLSLLTVLTHTAGRDASLGDPSEYSPAPILRLIFLFETIILAPPTANDPRQYNKLIPARLEAFRTGLFPDLYAAVYALPTTPQRTTNLDPTAINRQVEAAVRAGDFSAGIQRLSPEPRALLDAVNWPIIHNMHLPPIAPPSIHRPLAILPPLHMFHLDKLSTTLASSTRGKAPGFLADSPDFLLDIANKPAPHDSSQSGWDLLQYFFSIVLSDQLPPDLRAAFATNYLMALHKDFTHHPQKLRPIAFGDSKRRLLCRHIARINASRFAAYFLPHQFAIGISGGADIIIHSLMREVFSRVGVDAPESLLAAILKLDFKNMFNSTSRELIREELDQHFPDLLYLFDLLYPLDGNCVWFTRPDGTGDWFRQEEGESQGCPLSSFFSCLLLHKLLASLSIALLDRAQHHDSPDQPSYTMAFVDDTHAVSALSDVAFIFRYLRDHGPPMGLLLNPTKCSILLSTSGPAFFHRLSPAIQRDLTWAADTYCGGHLLYDGLIILGTPIGTPTYVSARLNDFTLAFTQTTHQLQLVQSPASRLRLYLTCVQHQVPSRLFADSCLPASTLSLTTGAHSPFILGIEKIARQFLSDLTLTPTLPDESWSLATLPVRNGGLGFLAPSSLALLSFLRPLFRTITYSITGIPILDFAQHAAPRPPNAPPPDPSQWIPLPPHLTQAFSNWETSTIPWLARFTRHLAPYLQVADPNIIPSTLFHDQTASPFSLLKTAHKRLLSRHYHTCLAASSPTYRALEPSLRSPYISIALTSLPLGLAAYRTPARLWTLGLQRKLRIPLLPAPLPCRCGGTVDIHCDHFFSCTKCSKTNLHNRIRDSMFLVLSHLAPLAHIASTSADVSCETSGLVPAFPTIRPADVAIRLIPGALSQPISHLLLDVTILPTPPTSSLYPPLAVSDDPFLTSVVQHHELGENKKFLGRPHRTRSPDAVTAAILHQRYCLVPCTVDPGGQFGPFTSSLLWSSKRHPAAILPLSTNRSTRGLPPLRIPANAAASLASASLLNLGILPKADHGWRETHGPNLWFTRDWSATLPSHWAQQVLGHNLLLGLSSHLSIALSYTHPVSTRPIQRRNLQTAAAIPRVTRPTLALPSAFFYPTNLVTVSSTA
jgi:hypothetical protein